MSCEVPVELREVAALAREGEAVRLGVPLPKGGVRDGAVLSVCCGDDAPWASQWRALSRWSDGSVQWALVDFVATVPACATQAVRLRWDAREMAAATPVATPIVTVAARDDGFRIDTGTASFEVPGGGASGSGASGGEASAGVALLSAAFVDGRSVLAADGLRLRLAPAAARGAGPARIHREAAWIEDAGPVRATLVLEGRVDGADRSVPLPFRARLAFTAGSTEVEIEVRVRNPRAAVHPGGLWDLGDPASMLIRDLSLRAVPATAPVRVLWCAEPGAGWVERAAGEFGIYQDSSGGAHWDSPNHLGADGSLTVSFAGYRVTEGAGRGLRELGAGARATPSMRVAGNAGWIEAFVEDFWQNFPKALRCAEGGLEIGLFPAESRAAVELQGGEQKRHFAWIAFGTGDRPCRLARHGAPLEAWVDPAWIEASGALPRFTAPAPGDDARLGDYLATLLEGPRSLQAGREAIDEYGWRNFGDAWADHEAVRHDGPGPFVSHYNNQYDLVLSAGLHALRERDARWLRVMRDAARHTVDIDIYHTREDKAAFSGGMFWHTDHYKPAGLATHRTYSSLNAGRGSYGGGPSSEHLYSGGLLLHHLLTGDADAADAVVALAEWVIAMDDGGRNLFGLLDAGPTGAASQTATPDYHGPGRGAGNAIRALLDADLLTRRRCYLAKAEELLERCIHPLDDVAARRLDDPEIRWSYLVFLQALVRYLDRKDERGERDQPFHYARESLLRYADWMLAHEVPYRDVLHKVAIPSETWPAHDLRKAEVMFEAACWAGDSGLREALAGRAAFFATRGLDDVLSFDTALLLRPRVIVAAQAAALRHFARRGASPRPHAPHAHDFGSPRAFVPQRVRWRTTLAARWTAARGDLLRELHARWTGWRRGAVARRAAGPGRAP